MTENKNNFDKEMPIMAHLMELRDRLLKAVIAIVVVFVCLIPFASDLYAILSAPLVASLPQNSTMIATDITATFFTPFKLAFFIAFVIAIPIVLHQAWSFIAPGLYSHEKKFAFPLLTSSVILFYVGMVFAYFVVFPIVFGFLSGIELENVTTAPDISTYLNLAMKLFFAFGLAFEVPIATVLLIWSGITTAESLAEKRPYIIVAAFIVGMLLTPPDAISQTLLAVPMWLMFEAGLFLSKFKPESEEEKREADNELKKQN